MKVKSNNEKGLEATFLKYFLTTIGFKNVDK